MIADIPQARVPYRQTLRHEGWLVELFVHTPTSLRHYWALDATARKASLLRMCADGHILTDRNDMAATIRAEARTRLAAGPGPLPSEELEQRRYRLTDLLDDLDGCDSSAELPYIAAGLLTAGSELILLSTGRWLDTGKWLARRLTDVDDTLASSLVTTHQAAVGAHDKLPLRNVVADILDRVGGPLREGYYAPGPDQAPDHP